jgi:enoyl-CoA hydratase/carnithine racemase
MSRPPVNALDPAWIDDLQRLLSDIESDPAVSVLVLRSDLEVFCAGADLGLMRELLTTPDGRDRMVAFVGRIQGALLRLERTSVVTVAEIGGAALGGGLELALACDLRVAAHDARLGLPEATLGLLPGAGGTQRLPRICGEAVARRLILGAEVIDGREAERLGMVQWARRREELAAWTAGLAERLGRSTPEALAASKRCIEASLDPGVDGYERELVETRQLHEQAETRARVRDLVERRR